MIVENYGVIAAVTAEARRGTCKPVDAAAAAGLLRPAVRQVRPGRTGRSPHIATPAVEVVVLRVEGPVG